MMSDSPPISLRHLGSAVKKLENGAVLIIGDIMVDEYLLGNTERISPEAPVPVVHIREERLMLGGAGNVARNIKSLGGHAHLVSVVGQDSAAQRLNSLVHNEGLTADFIQIQDRPTTIKTRILAQQQQMLRVDRETTAPVTEADCKKLLRRVEAVWGDFAVVVISDYGKGLVTKQLLAALQKVSRTCSKPPLILVDPKTPNFHLYTDVYLLTPNAKETSEGAGLPAKTPEEIIRAGRELFRKLNCAHLLTTLGAQGMALFSSPDEIWHIPTTAQSVFDVTGAGDTVIAVTALGLAAGLSLLDACILANYAAGIVVGEVGAAVTTQDTLQKALRNVPAPSITRWG